MGVGVGDNGCHPPKDSVLNTDEILETLFCEAESMIDCRPLTKLDDPDDLSPLTFSHFLILRRGITIPPPPLPDNFDWGDM